jgi:hypothetical protein
MKVAAEPWPGQLPYPRCGAPVAWSCRCPNETRPATSSSGATLTGLCAQRSNTPRNRHNRHRNRASGGLPFGMPKLAVFALPAGGLAVMDSSDTRRVVAYAKELCFVGLLDSGAGRTLAELDREAGESPGPSAVSSRRNQCPPRSASIHRNGPPSGSRDSSHSSLSGPPAIAGRGTAPSLPRG